MKKAIITSISPGYMFAMHCNMVTNKFFGTNADVHLIHRNMNDELEYMKRCESAFPFKVVWVDMNDVQTHCFHNAKYKYAASLAGQYDVVCLIDADLFIIANLNKYFDIAHYDKKFITAQHLWSGGKLNEMNFGNWEAVVDRAHSHLADFPVFIDPVHYQDMLLDWYNFTLEDPDHERSHPLVAFNRSICKNVRKEDIILLPGDQWVCDMNFWQVQYDWNREKNCMTSMEKQEAVTITKSISAIHNKWWKVGRANGEWLANRNYHDVTRLDRGEHNFNEIRDMMEYFNELGFMTKRDDYLKGRIDRKAYLATVP